MIIWSFDVCRGISIAITTAGPKMGCDCVCFAPIFFAVNIYDGPWGWGLLVIVQRMDDKHERNVLCQR